MTDTPLLTAQQSTQLSKLLSYVLRHGAAKEKITIRPDGYVLLTDLLSLPKFKKVTLEQIQYVVDTNDKKRYEMSLVEGEYYIRASQGHSIQSVQSNSLLTAITDIQTPVIHGTHMNAWNIIREEGLSRMGRNHIHLAAGLPSDTHVISGMRKSSDVFIYIDTDKARKDGILFYLSKNGVILTDGKKGVLSPIYFDKVVDKQGNRLL
ncbi:phosphotransferase KptA/Tpt1 [Pilobolus umbonatus]|nr:phosphotransferase KptA/Tpt1 [Pilobolus umbonatus]